MWGRKKRLWEIPSASQLQGEIKRRRRGSWPAPPPWEEKRKNRKKRSFLLLGGRGKSFCIEACSIKSGGGKSIKRRHPAKRGTVGSIVSWEREEPRRTLRPVGSGGKWSVVFEKGKKGKTEGPAK